MPNATSDEKADERIWTGRFTSLFITRFFGTATYFMLKKYKEAGITLNGGGEENERLKIVP